MENHTIADPHGNILRPIHKTKTTENSNSSIKPIISDSTTLEVFVFDAVMQSPGSQFGHVALDIDGTTYSRAHGKYVELDTKAYLDSNQKIRAFEGLLLRVSPSEKEKIRTELKRRIALNKPYSIAINSCSTNVADVLEQIGILAHDPRFKINPESTELVSPKEILIVVSRSKRMVRRNHYRKLGQ